MCDRIVISALWQNRVRRDVELIQPTHVFSFLDPGFDISFSNIVHFKYFFEDLTDQNATVLDDNTLANIISCFDDLIILGKEKKIRVLLHCHMGISRSTSLSYIFISRALGNNREQESFNILLKISNKPWPNHGIIAQADRMCGKNGALLAPLEEYRLNNPLRHSAYRRLNQKQSRKDWLLRSEYFNHG